MFIVAKVLIYNYDEIMIVGLLYILYFYKICYFFAIFITFTMLFVCK